MATLKVLIFDHERGFTEGLRRAFEARGSTVFVVSQIDSEATLSAILSQELGADGNRTLGPADALILLSAELPGMNGYALCSRIKKRDDLRNVPLMIVSSAATAEAFDQHSKLRSRADDYVHKPISPDELLNRASRFVSLGGARDSVELGADDLVVLDETAMLESPSSVAPPPKPVDAEVSGLTDEAFSNIMLEPAPESAQGPGPAGDDFEDFTMIASRAELPPIPSAPLRSAPPPRPASIPAPMLGGLTPPPPIGAARTGLDHDRMSRQVEGLERDLQAARNEASRLRTLADESATLRRELDELRAKAARASVASPSGGGVSTREFLELREALNRKDKDILQLRESVNNRDKELLELRDKILQADLSRADFDDRLIERERAFESLREELEQTRETGTAASARLRALETELTAATTERDDQARALAAAQAAHLAALAAAESRQSEALTARDAAQAEALAARDAAHAEALAAAEARLRALEAAHAEALSALKTELEQAHEVADKVRQQSVASAETLQRTQAEALAAHEAAKTQSEQRVTELEAQLRERSEALELRQKASETLEAEGASLRAKLEAEEAARAAAEKAHAEALAAAEKAHAEALAAAEKAHAEALAAAEKAHAEALEAQASEAGQRSTTAENERQRLVAAHAAALAAQIAAHEAAIAASNEAHAKAIEAIEAQRDAQAERADKLARKASHDREVLDRARRALDIAAALVDETQRSDATPAESARHASSDAE